MYHHSIGINYISIKGKENRKGNFNALIQLIYYDFPLLKE